MKNIFYSPTVLFPVRWDMPKMTTDRVGNPGSVGWNTHCQKSASTEANMFSLKNYAHNNKLPRNLAEGNTLQ